MRVKNIELTNFRTYLSTRIELTAGVNIFKGPNGVGKTNLLEAIGYLSAFSSHRTATDLPLINVEADSAIIKAGLAKASRETDLAVEIGRGRSKEVRLAGSRCRSRDAAAIFRSVIFSPEDLAIVKGDPANRRTFLDRLLIQLFPRYLAVIGDYDRVLKQRNALLRSISSRSRVAKGDTESSTLRVWDEQLATAAAGLIQGRLELVENLKPYFSAAYALIAPQSKACILYRSASLDCQEIPFEIEKLEQLIRQRLAEVAGEEKYRGTTLIGPHRDELEIFVDKLPARGYASHGESWSLALALKLGSLELLRQQDRSEADPVLLLDDVFAELDSSRRDFLADICADSEQSIITVAVDRDIPDALTGSVYQVYRGSVEKL